MHLPNKTNSYTQLQWFVPTPKWSNKRPLELCCPNMGELDATADYRLEGPMHPERAAIVFTRSGGGLLTVEGQPWTLKPGSVVALFPGEFRIQEIAPSCSHWTCCWFDLVGNGSAEALHHVGLEPDHRLRTPVPSNHLHTLQQEAKRILGKDAASLPATAALAWQVIDLLSPLTEPDPIPAPTRQSRAGAAWNLIQHQFPNGITVAEVADQLGVSRATLHRDFRKHFGMSPKQFIDELRLDRAHHLLAEGRYSVKEVAARTGFTDRYHLHQAYKRRFGEPPGRAGQAASS